MPKKDEIERTSIIEKKYAIGKSKKDNEIGQYTEYHDSSTNLTVICQEKMFSDRASLLKEIEKVKKKILNKNEYFLNTLDYSVKIQKNWCSTLFLLKIFMEKPQENLKKLINKHKGKGLPMQELTHLFYQLVYSNSFLQQKNQNHGNITPESIFVQQKSQYKISQGLFQGLSPDRINMQKILLNEPIYLSPKIYESLKKRMYQYLNHDQNKSDVFSAGLVILEAGLGKSIQNIYFTSQIDESVLENLLQEFQDKFTDNPLLSSSVRKMLEVKENQRPNFVNLKQVIPDYKTVLNFFNKNDQQNQDIQDNDQDNYSQQQRQKNDQKNQQKYFNKQERNVQSSNKNLSYQQNSLKSEKFKKSQNQIQKSYKQKIPQKQNQLNSAKLDKFDFFDVYDNKNQNSGNSTREDVTKDNSQYQKQKQTIDNFFDVQPKPIPFKSKQNHHINNHQKNYYQPQQKYHQKPIQKQYGYQNQYQQHYQQRSRPISQNQYYNGQIAPPKKYHYRPNSQHQYMQNYKNIPKQTKVVSQSEKNFFDL